VFPSESRSEAWSRRTETKLKKQFFAFNAADYEEVSFLAPYAPDFPVSDQVIESLKIKRNMVNDQPLFFWVDPRGFIGFFNPVVYPAIPTLPADEIFRPFDFARCLDDYNPTVPPAAKSGSARSRKRTKGSR
jgi:hypothetical protein